MHVVYIRIVETIKMNNFSIGTRLRLAFGLLIGMTLVVAAVGIASMDSLNEVSTDMADSIWSRAIQANLALDNARGSFGRLAQLSQSDSKLRGDGAERLAANIRGFNDALGKLAPMLVRPDGKALLATSLQKRDTYVQICSRVLELTRNGKTDEANALTFGEGYSALHAFAGSLRAQIVFQEKRFDAKNSEADVLFNNRRYVVFYLTIIIALVSLSAAIFITRSIVRPLAQAVDVARTVSAGDLTSRIEVRGKDETAQLMQALYEMNTSLLTIVTQVRSGSQEIAVASSEIASGNLELSSRTEQQASALEETASSMEEIASTVKQNSDNAQLANELATTASDIARNGGKVVARVVDTMTDIDADSREIVNIISVIDGIAFQTNILALNAAVEAARAGEQGRGFAVVATEVRSLAQRSSLAAKEIKELIENSVKKINAGLMFASDAGITMNQVVESVQRVNNIVSEISNAGREQEAGISQINLAISEMDSVTQQNAALVEEAASAAASLQEQATNQSQMVSVFKLHVTMEERLNEPAKKAAGRIALHMF